MKLYTSRYSNPALADADALTVQTSLGFPRFPLRYKPVGKAKLITPTRPMLAQPTQTAYKRMYIDHLDRAGVDAIRAELAALAATAPGKPLILLCFEDVRKEDQWCHRCMFAEWWQMNTGEVVAEWPHPAPKTKPAAAQHVAPTMPGLFD